MPVALRSTQFHTPFLFSISRLSVKAILCIIVKAHQKRLMREIMFLRFLYLICYRIHGKSYRKYKINAYQHLAS